MTLKFSKDVYYLTQLDDKLKKNVVKSKHGTMILLRLCLINSVFVRYAPRTGLGLTSYWKGVGKKETCNVTSSYF